MRTIALALAVFAGAFAVKSLAVDDADPNSVVAPPPQHDDEPVHDLGEFSSDIYLGGSGFHFLPNAAQDLLEQHPHSFICTWRERVVSAYGGSLARGNTADEAAERF